MACFAAAMSAPIYLHLPFLSFTVCDLILMHFSSWALLFPSSPCQIELHRRPEHSKPSPSAVRRPRSFPVPHSVKATQLNQPASEAGPPGEVALAVIIDRPRCVLLLLLLLRFRRRWDFRSSLSVWRAAATRPRRAAPSSHSSYMYSLRCTPHPLPCDFGAQHAARQGLMKGIIQSHVPSILQHIEENFSTATYQSRSSVIHFTLNGTSRHAKYSFY